MRIIRFLDVQGGVRLGLESDRKDVELLEGDLYAGPQRTGRTARVGQLLAPVQPVNIFCIGLNYREHAAESGMAPPESPVVFMKPTTTLCNPGQPVRVPASRKGDEVDYECELAVVIGRAARNVRVEDALQYVLGYTCANDVSARLWQAHGGGGQWIRGKGFDTFCPLGPVLVTTDEIPDPQTLQIRTILNGQVMQNQTTADMIFSVAQLVSFLSQDVTLLPGTLVLTGTPQGVGFARKPPVCLHPGDEIVIEIDGIGRLSNPVTAAV